MAHKIPFDKLVDYAEGRLSEAEREQLTAQLQADPGAAVELAQVQQLIALMRSDASEDAPAYAINRALRLLRQRRAGQAGQPGQPGLLRRIMAALTFDSALSLAPGMRSSISQTRQLLFTAENLDLDVRITPDRGTFVVSGQVLGPEVAGEATLAGDAITVHATVTALGEFSFPGVPAGQYTLTWRHGDLEVVIPRLELGASRT